MNDEDRQTCKICQAYFYRPWRQTNKCCSEECSTINRRSNERNRKRGEQRFTGIHRETEAWKQQRARKACGELLERLRGAHPERAA